MEKKLKKYLKILKKCPLFFDIEDENLTKMLSCLGAKVDFFDKKYTIFAEDRAAKYVGILLSGTAHVIRNDYYGNRNIISEIVAGQLFGEAFACADVKALPVSIIADEPCEVMLIDASHILHTCHNNCPFHQRMIYNLMRDLAEKTLAFHQKIEILSKPTTSEKLMAYLDLYSKKTGKTEFDIPFDRQELADFLDVDRSGLSVEIGKLKKRGIIEARKNHFVLL